MENNQEVPWLYLSTKTYDEIQNVICKITKENEKYGTFIDILKSKFNFRFVDSDKIVYLFIKELPVHIYTWRIETQQEYDCLKEMLGPNCNYRKGEIEVWKKK